MYRERSLFSKMSMIEAALALVDSRGGGGTAMTMDFYGPIPNTHRHPAAHRVPAAVPAAAEAVSDSFSDSFFSAFVLESLAHRCIIIRLP